MDRILVVDDDASLRRVLEYNLSEEGYVVETAGDGGEALEKLGREAFALVVTDIKMPGMDGMDLLKRIKADAPDTQVIVITAFGTIEMAVEAMKSGAFEYILKPFNRDELKLAVKKALRYGSLERENERLTKEVSKRFGFENLIGDSPAMGKVLSLVAKVAESEAPVLITGESGTGKELVARAIHYRSGRRKGPFVAINCAAIPRDLLESEFFGHRKGAFTGAVRDRQGKFLEADGGTLFLDEIGELPVELQAKLLRALQEREITPVGGEGVTRFDARVLSATNIDLEEAIGEGKFREDLYYRLAVVPIHIPSLKERSEDIALLAAHFIGSHPYGAGVSLSRDALKALEKYSWKGNVRELENTIERAMVLKNGNVITPDDLPERITAPREGETANGRAFSFLFPDEGLSLEEAEKSLILAALERAGGNQTRAANLLRIPRHVLLYRMEKFGIQRKSS